MPMIAPPNVTNAPPDLSCAQQLEGDWLMQATTLESLRGRAFSVNLVDLARFNAEQRERRRLAVEQQRAERQRSGAPADAAPPKPYAFRDGTAIITISGPTTKHPTSFQEMFGGTATTVVERQLTAARHDPDVSRVMLNIEDAPGGTVAGAYELRDAIVSFRQFKPIHAHITDLGASAAYLFASACDRVTANRTAYVGSIGTLTHLLDTSGKFEKKGVRVIPIAEGTFKAMGMKGVPVSAEWIAERQAHIRGLNDLFVESVATHRRVTPEHVRGLQARVMLAPAAVEAKLLDGVCTFESAMGELQSKGKTSSAPSPRPHNNPATGSMQMNWLEQMRILFNDPNLTEAQAWGKVMTMHQQAAAHATALQALTAERDQARAALPKAPDADLVAGTLELVEQRVELAVAAGVPQVAATKLLAACGALSPEQRAAQEAAATPEARAAIQPKPVAAVLTKQAALGGRTFADFALDLLQTSAKAKPGPANGDGQPKTPTQMALAALKRQTPDGDKGDERQQLESSADDDVQQHLRDRGIPVETK